MTTIEFDKIQWRSGMRITIGNLLEDVVSVNLRERTIAIEDGNGLVWINSEFVTLKHTLMSDLKHVLDIMPPVDNRSVEKKAVRNVECPSCHGTGGFKDGRSHNDEHYTECSQCDGTGKVKAVITIEWTPDYN